MRKTALFLSALILGAAGCDSDNVNGNDESRLTILLTDAPGDVLEAVVTISEIYLQGGPADAEAGGRVMLRTEPITTDLVTLANDLETLVEAAIVPAGSYGQMRFVIDGAYIKVDGAGGAKVYATAGYDEAPAQVDGNLHCPSCAQSGIKVNFTGNLNLEAETETILVDFDVAGTFGHQAGNSGMWVMNPSLKAARVEAAATVSASLSLGTGVSLPIIGGVTLTLGSFEAELRAADAQDGTTGETVTFTDTDGDGTFTARFTNVLPGDYTVLVHGPAGLTFSTQPSMPMSIDVGSGATVTAVFVVTAAQSSS
ncbi:MAG: DUF4382 domain-containing protein [Gemmatimonadetes bacterium]|nr:DUF4382 domain-containing protein [Gemmatimonadota bacterium]